MTQEEILRILMKGAEKQKDDLNDYTKGKRDGLVEAYSHAWTLVKKLTIPVVVGQSEQYYCADRENNIEDANCTYQCDHCKDIERKQ